jgi:MFS transporter, PPP family, 3-phenylpropionic acid transporter
VTPLRLSFFYAAFYSAMAIFLPFWPVWLAGKGLDAGEIGLVLAVGMGMRLFTTPLVGHIADRHGERRNVMIVLAAGGLATYAFFGLSEGLAALLAVTIVFAAFWNPLAPMSEALTVLVARAEGFEYGRIRLWGSISFIVVAVAAGRLLAAEGSDVLFTMGFGAVALTFVATLLLPGHKAPPAGRRLTWGPVLADRSFLWMMAAAACAQASHSVYYGFSTLHWRSVGHSDTLIGLLWAEGVVAEIVLFAAAAPLMRRWGPEKMLALASLAGVIRWTVLAWTDWLPVLIAVQALHAFSFGAAHLGAMHFIGRSLPPTLSATAQSLYSVTAIGIAVGAATAVSGALYETWGSGAYLAMTGLAALGLIAARILASRVENSPAL